MSLGNADGSIRQYLGFLRNDNVSLGPLQHGTLEAVPGVAFAGFDSPEPLGDPPSGIVLDRTEGVDTRKLHLLPLACSHGRRFGYRFGAILGAPN